MVDSLLKYGYLFIFAGTIFEGDATLLTAAFLAHRGHFALVPVMLTAGAASVALNEAIFHGARRAGKAYLERRVARHERYLKIQQWVRRRSILLLLFSRYIFGFRLAIPIACGAVGMRPLLFTLINLAGALLWVVPVGVAGYALGSLLTAFWDEIRHYEWHIAVALLVLVTALLAWFDPELRRTASYLLHLRRAAVISQARVRRLLWRDRRHRPVSAVTVADE